MHIYKRELLGLPLFLYFYYIKYLSSCNPLSFCRLFFAPPSRALRSLPLSVMMSGNFYWGDGNLNARGAYGFFWSSTPYSYTYSRYLNFGSTNVNPKYGFHKPHGLTLRCVTFQSSPQPPSFGYVVGQLRVE